MKGVGILVDKVLIPHRGYLEVIKDESTAEYDLLMCRADKLIIISVYVHVGSTDPSGIYDDLAITIQDVLDRYHEGPVVMCGDFNYGDHHSTLTDVMEGIGFKVLYDGDRPRPTHANGGVLDAMFVRLPADADGMTIRRRGDHHDHYILEAHIELPPSEPKSLPFEYKKYENLSAEQQAILKEDMVKVACKAADLGDPNILQDGTVDTLERHLGRQKPRHHRPPQPWFSAQIKEAKRQCQQAYTYWRDAPSDATFTIKEAAKSKYEKLLKQLQRRALREQAAQVDAKALSIWRVVPPRHGPPSQTRVIYNMSQQQEHITELFHDPDPFSISDFLVSHNDVDDDRDYFVEKDIAEAFKAMKDKTPAEDDIRLRVLKACSCRELNRAIAKLFSMLASRNQPLPDWMRQGTGQMLFKKGNREDPANYRLIVMGTAYAKLYEKVLEQRGWRLINEGLMSLQKEQGGFRPKFGTEEQVFLLQSLRAGQAKMKGKKMYTAFLDIRKAFDTVNHKKLLQVLQNKGATPEFLNIVRVMLVERKVSLGDELIAMMKGTPQGSPSSPLLFILFIDPLIERLRVCTGIPLTAEENLQSLFFADDIALCAETIEDLQRMLIICDEWASEYNITFNAAKSEVMQLTGKKEKEKPEVKLGGKPLKWVTEFKYLGMMIYERQPVKVKTPRKTLWGKLHHFRRNLSPKSGLPLDQQLIVLHSIVMSTALYPAALFDMDYKDIDKFVNKHLRRMTGLDKRSSATFLRCELGLAPAELEAHIRCLSLLWRLENQVWYKDLLGDLIGTAPYQRLKAVARQHELTTTMARSLSKEKWGTLIREKVNSAAEHRLREEATDKHMPAPEPGLQARLYVKQGGYLAQYGVQLRWHLHRHKHSVPFVRGLDPGPSTRCTCCGSSHPALAVYKGQSLICRRITHSGLRRLRKRVLCSMEKEHDGQNHPRVTPAMIDRLTDLAWNNQSVEMTRQVLELAKRTMLAPLPTAQAPTEAMIDQRMGEYLQMERLGFQLTPLPPAREPPLQAPQPPAHTPTTGQPPQPQTLPFMQAQRLFEAPNQDMVNEVEIQWANPNEDDVVADEFNMRILRSDLKRLQGNTMLNDELMNFYGQLLLRRDRARRTCMPTANSTHRGCHFMNTYFMSKLVLDRGVYDYAQVKSWTERLTPGLFEHEKVFVPINVNKDHWTLAVIDMPTQTIKYYDSMGGTGSQYLKWLLRYLKDEWSAKKKGVPPPDWELWTHIVGSRATPQQGPRSLDCGVFVLYIADLLSQDLPVQFTQDDVTNGLCRHRLAYRILNKSLES